MLNLQKVWETCLYPLEVLSPLVLAYELGV